MDFYEHSGEAVIVSAIGARCGKCFYASGKWTAIKNTIVIKSEQACILFLYFYLNDERRWLKSGTGQPFISVGKAKLVLVPFPPLAEQQAIARILQTVDEKIAAEEKRKAALAALFKSLLAQLMSGQVRLPKEFVAQFAQEVS